MFGVKNFAGKILIILVFSQVVYWAAGAGKKTAKVPAAEDVEKIIRERIKATPKSQLNRYKADAAKRLQSNLVRAFKALSSNDKSLNPKVRTSAKSAMTAVQSGKLNPALTKGLPVIMSEASTLQGKPADQLKAILGNVLPNAPTALKGPLQGVQDFVSTNLNGVNTLLSRTLGGATDLLGGVVKTLIGSLGGLSAAVNGTATSLGVLLGGLL